MNELIDRFVKQEKESQLILNAFYSKSGWIYDRSVACKQYDLLISGKRIEEKFRYANYNDFLIEIIQDILTENMGWYYTTKCDYLFYIVCDKELYSVKWELFKEWFFNNWKYLQMESIIAPGGYGLTINIAISWFIIPKELYKYFEINPK